MHRAKRSSSRSIDRRCQPLPMQPARSSRLRAAGGGSGSGDEQGAAGFSHRSPREMNAGLRTPPRTPLRVHAAEQKQVCRAGGLIDRRIDDGARLENGEFQGPLCHGNPALLRPGDGHVATSAQAASDTEPDARSDTRVSSVAQVRNRVAIAAADEILVPAGDRWGRPPADRGAGARVPPAGVGCMAARAAPQRS